MAVSQTPAPHVPNHRLILPFPPAGRLPSYSVSRSPSSLNLFIQNFAVLCSKSARYMLFPVPGVPSSPKWPCPSCLCIQRRSWLLRAQTSVRMQSAYAPRNQGTSSKRFNEVKIWITPWGVTPCLLQKERGVTLLLIWLGVKSQRSQAETLSLRFSRGKHQPF